MELALAAKADEPSPATADEQLEMLGVSPAESRIVDLRAMREASESRRGRPEGARNRRTLAMAEYLLKRYSSPLEGLLSLASMRVDELAVALGCTKLEAMQEIDKARIAALPYCHSKMPVSVDVTNRKVIRIIIDDEVEIEEAEDQQLSIARTIESHIVEESES